MHPKRKYQKLNVSKVKNSRGMSRVVGPITIEYKDATIIPKIAYTVALLLFSKHFRTNLVKKTIPKIIPNPKTIKIGKTEKSKFKNNFILVMIGMYIPKINRMVEPETPGKIIADMATIAAKKV